MTRSRFAALALVLATFAGCHEDPKVQQVIVPGSATALAIFTNGGTGSTTGNTNGTGSNGGAVLGKVVGDLNLGGSTTLTNPTIPAAPTSGNTPLTSPTTGTPGGTTGTVIISGTVNIDIATPTPVFQTTNGDIVVSGNLRTVIPAGTQNDITLSAPAGTVYVTGTITTSSSDGTASGDFGGNVTINAARIVVTGTIDTRGENGPAVGGDGGTVTMNASTGEVIVTGSILTSGGTGTTGGNGGAISLTAATKLHLFGIVTTDGGVATDSGAKPVGGDAGNVTLAAGSGADVSATIHQIGGNGNGGTQGADGGNGGSFGINGFIPVKVYGTLDLRGGTASATSIGVATLIGGLGGAIDLGNSGPSLASLELGRGTWSTIGGSGVDAVGNGGAITLRSDDGNVSLGSDLDTHGGSATGTANVAGGTGGGVTISGDQGPSSQSNHPLTVNFLASVTTTGGAGTGTGNGGIGGGVGFRSGGDITLPIAITTTGGTAVNGTGGQGGPINVTVDNAGTPPAAGDVLITGVMTASGGVSTTGSGGNGGDIMIDTISAALGRITSSADITSSGTNGTTGAAVGGAPGNIRFQTNLGDITLSGKITANGGSSIVTPSSATAVIATAGISGGSITSSAIITASGGGSLASSAVNVSGGAGATILFTVLNLNGTIRLETTSSITANGGGGTGSSAGGAGGTFTFTTGGQFVSMSGTLTGFGGNNFGTGSGGQGGQVVVTTNGTGDITLNSNSFIEVSSGTGSGGGSARNNAGGSVDPAANLALIAVVFDAAGDFTTSPDAGTEGVVQNLGTITALGRGINGNGGDVYFDGRQPGVATDPLPGFQNRAGSGSGLTGLFSTN